MAAGLDGSSAQLTLVASGGRGRVVLTVEGLNHFRLDDSTLAI